MKPWHAAVVSFTCLAIVLSVMGWITAKALELEKSQLVADRQAALEEDIRLALWRLDSAVAPVIARENARPYFAYSAFYPAERAYTRMFSAINRGDVLVPSKLLANTSPFIVLHFQFDPAGVLTSPQAPEGNMRDLAEASYVRSDQVRSATKRLDELRKRLDVTCMRSALPSIQTLLCPTETDEPPIARTLQNEGLWNGQTARQSSRSSAEFQKRTQSYSQNAVQSKTGEIVPGEPTDIKEGWLQPVWIDRDLILARRVSVDKKEYLQGCWLDWTALQTALEAEISDLLPNAHVEPARDPKEAKSTRRLAALPAILLPGTLDESPVNGLSPLRLSLIVAWVFALLAGGAVAALAIGAVRLSERRGAFVSAVTHELRTPLTTFRMYSEMLAEGMVEDPIKRQSYLGTLRAEADRLGCLVENVLAYARLERGRAGAAIADIQVGELFDGLTDRLTQRCKQAGMEFVVEADETTRDATLRGDRLGIEQILFNLVDNSCKYATAATDRRVVLKASLAGRRTVEIAVSDFGAGIDVQAFGRLFSPFRKSAQAAANSAPGVGIGLALSRRLARKMSGDLRPVKQSTKGVTFALTLPLA